MAYSLPLAIPHRTLAARAAKLFGALSTAQAQIARRGIVKRSIIKTLSASPLPYVPPRKNRSRRAGWRPKWYAVGAINLSVPSMALPALTPTQLMGLSGITLLQTANAAQMAGNAQAQVARAGVVPLAAARTVFARLIPARHVTTYGQIYG